MKGGLSGKPIKNLSTNLIKKFYSETKGKIQIIGVGGVDSGPTAFEKIIAELPRFKYILVWFLKVRE